MAENLRVAFGRRAAFDAACERALAGFPLLRARFRQRAGTLSGGEQKMLLVARALLPAPRLILADEVTEGVQPMQIGRMGEALRDINAAGGTTLVLVEQHLDFALEMAGRYLVMKQGRIAAAGRADAPEARAAVEAQLSL